MVKIRLRRVGAKKQPSYRIVVASSTSPRDGRFLEVIGHYNPRTEPETVVVDVERSRYWLGHGAQPTEAVMRLLKKGGVFDTATQPAAAPSATPPIAAAAAVVPVAEPAIPASPAAAITEPTPDITAADVPPTPEA